VSRGLAHLQELADAPVMPGDVRWERQLERLNSSAPERMCECGCGLPIPPGCRVTRRFATKTCYVRAHRRREHVKADKARRDAERVSAVRGRVCATCQATDAEVPWSKCNDACSACHRTRFRRARGKRLIDVIVLDEATDREKTFKRDATSGWVSVAGQLIKVVEEPLVVSLPTEVWVRVRR
jgi:hypothetical protein